MTVSYSREVATTKLGTFLRLLFRWKGSIYRIIYREMIVYLCLYYFVCVIYQFVLSNELKRKFADWSHFCRRYTDIVPLTFVLGFYISIIVGRWWNTFLSLNWPDRVCLQIQCLVHGQDERGRMIRRTAARYVNLAQVLVLRDISSAVRKRFPTLQHLVEAGFFSEEELKQYECAEMLHHKFFVPLQWTCSLLTKARKEALIDADPLLLKMIEEVLQVRTNLMALVCYDWISVPLVYTQVVTIAVYSYFLACLFSRQYLISSTVPGGHDVTNEDGSETDMYFPLFTLLQFVFYMGWLKVAESIMNPLGEDDDDFEVNYMIDRNLQVAYFIVDDNCMKIPPLTRDIHWNEFEANVPHTEESAGLKNQPYVPSAVLNPVPTESNLKTSPSIVSMLTTDGSKRRKQSRQNSTSSTHPPNLQMGQENNLADGGGVHRSLRRLISTASRKFSSPPDPESISQLTKDSHEANIPDIPGRKKVASSSDIGNMTMTPFIEGQLSPGLRDSKHILFPVSEVANEEVENLAFASSRLTEVEAGKTQRPLSAPDSSTDGDMGLIMFVDEAEGIKRPLLAEKQGNEHETLRKLT